MGRPPLKIEVSQKDQKQLAKILRSGVQQVRVVLRALALLQLAKGVASPRIAGVVPLTAQSIRNVGRRYQQGGLDRALYEKSRPGAAEVLDDSQKQRLIAMVCIAQKKCLRLSHGAGVPRNILMYASLIRAVAWRVSSGRWFRAYASAIRRSSP